eukprot:TRINITY_DN7611_c0_g1_i1.p1 TRINITY_DN7611_c0_g1~~TRINITY_DN7611_c0_g1_i1.p1  ORF type:complete len:299 (-),score=88.79 TRINITY_DN7611_c0_g1_i1:455-1351(-)
MSSSSSSLSSSSSSSSSASLSTDSFSSVVTGQSTPSTTLLDVVVDEYSQDRDSRVSRLLITAEVDPERITDIRKFHEEFFTRYNENNSQNNKKNNISGVLFMINNQVLVHLCEAPSKLLFILLRALANVTVETVKDQKDQKASKSNIFASLSSSSSSSASSSSVTQPLLRNVRICSFSEEVPREFPRWDVRAVRVQSEEFSRPSDFVQAIWSILKSCLDLGHELQQMSEEKAGDYIANNNSRQFLQRIPLPQQIMAHASCDDLCSVSDFLSIYDSPIECTLESEKVWPAENFSYLVHN